MNHEHFEELCAAASVGQATPEELFELEQHARSCTDCQQRYWNDLNFAAHQMVAHREPGLSAHETEECLNSELFLRRFFARAQHEGIVFSQAVDMEVKSLGPRRQLSGKRSMWPRLTFACASAMVILAVVLGAYFYPKRSIPFEVASTATNSHGQGSQFLAMNQRFADLEGMNARLQVQVEGLKNDLRKVTVQLSSSHEELRASFQIRKELEAQRDTLEAKLENLQQQLADSQKTVSDAQQTSAQLREHSLVLESTIANDRSRIDELTADLNNKSAALDRERQLLVLGHDVTDLMGARNLHIVDVVDTDPRGKARPSFGRIFFTEGKSLLFYAYDLNETKIQKANYQYRVWAKKEGQEKPVRSLGFFYSDDKSQRRWVFKCTDAKVLNEIDSVFVTLEPPQSDPSHPHGPNLMYAYLRGQPNHP